MRTDRHTYMMKLVAAFRNFEGALNNHRDFKKKIPFYLLTSLACDTLYED